MIYYLSHRSMYFYKNHYQNRYFLAKATESICTPMANGLSHMLMSLAVFVAYPTWLSKNYILLRASFLLLKLCTFIRSSVLKCSLLGPCQPPTYPTLLVMIFTYSVFLEDRERMLRINKYMRLHLHQSFRTLQQVSFVFITWHNIL